MLVHPNMDPVALDLGFLEIHWYGLMYLFGFLAAYILCRQRAKAGKAPFLVEQVDDLIFYAALGVIIGARMGYMLFYGLDALIAEPTSIFKVWQGGMSFHGGFLGVIIAVYWYCKKQQIPMGSVFDIIVTAAPLGLFFGRMGNFIGQELWGRETNVPWGMLFPKDPLALTRHPSQLYEAFLEGILLFAIMIWFTHKPKPQWSPAALFVMLYGVFRFVVEFFREPDAHIGFDILGIFSRGQLLSLPMVIVGIALFIWAYKTQTPVDFGAYQKQQKKNSKRG